MNKILLVTLLSQITLFTLFVMYWIYIKNLMKLLVIYLFFAKLMSAENICGIVWRYRPQRAKGFSLFGVFYCIYIYTYVALLKIGLLG